MNDSYYWKLKVRRKGYDPSQPRVPAGDPRGGQWVSGDVGVWGGVQGLPREEIIAEDAADFVLNHSVGERPSAVLEQFVGDLVLGPDRTLGDWARETLADLRPKRLYEQGKDFLKPRDLERMRSLPADVWEKKRILQQVSSQEMPDVDRTALESEYGISRYAIFPDVKPTGTWEFKDGVFLIKISRVSEDKRRTFWHEFSHTIPDFQIRKVIGPPKPGETAADYSDRFAEAMVG